MRVSYHRDYAVALPPGHPFPMRKFPALHALLLAEGIVRAPDVVAPEPASLEDLARVHTESYLRDLATGALSRAAERRLGLPCSPALWRRSRRAAGGTLGAARMALADGIAANLAGGTHHAFPDHGEGFCVLNDVAVAIRVLRHEGRIRRALVIDLDVHQGNGTAAIFRDDPDTWTFSMHGARNYPFAKERSTRDVALPDGIGDDGYLAALEAHLPELLRESRADLALYLAGVDPVKGDRFGRLGLSETGLARRERFVLRKLEEAALPVAVLLSGGYAETPERTASLHAVVHREARRLYGATP